MKFLFLIFFVFVQFATFCHATDFDKIVSPHLDKKINWLIKEHSSKSKILETFGKSDLVEKNTYYYSFNNFKYSLAIKFEKNKLNYFNYKAPSNTQIFLSDFKNTVKATDVESIPEGGHEKGKYLRLNLKEENLQLIFSNNSEKQLVRIIYDNK